MSQECVVFTGTLTQVTRKEATAQAQAKGYQVASSLSRNVTLLVYGDKAGKKLEEAKKLSIKTMNEEEWIKLVETSTPSTSTTTTTTTTTSPSPIATQSSKRKASNDQHKQKPISTQQIVVFTGALTKFTRKEATAQAEACGFLVGSSITKQTTLLVAGDRAGKKIEDAKKHSIKVLTEEEWLDLLETSTSGSTKKAKTSTIETSDGQVDFDTETGAINGILPQEFLPDGQFRDVQSTSSGSIYTIKRSGSVYMCSCPAWKNQHHAPTRRTCKHLKQVLGDEYENARAKASAVAPRTCSGIPTKSTAPKVLLAYKWDREKQDPVNWWISEKLDGVRAFWDGTKRVFLSRLGNVYPAPEWFTKDLPSYDLDGELFGGRGKFQSTVGIVKTQGSKQWTEIVYKVFDVPRHNGIFEERMAVAQKMITDSKLKHLEWVEHIQCKSLKHLDEMFEDIEKKGGEGLMIRQPKSMYAEGRSSSLLKIKSFHDGEAKVIGYEQGKGKYQSMTGALRCQMACGKMFKVASGLTDQQRATPPKIGSIIVYKCQELTNDGIPRFPIFLGVAPDKTVPKDPIISNQQQQL